LFLLVDGIYPKYSRFVKGIKDPLTQQEKSYTGWQEAARKDIERAFGVLQGQWKFMAHPLDLMSLDVITSRVVTCLILHNMNVSDRVMKGDVRAVYKPTNILPDRGGDRDAPPTLDVPPSAPAPGAAGGSPTTSTISGSTSSSPSGIFGGEGNGGGNLGIPVDTVNSRWLHLSDPVEHARLYAALSKKFEE
jgi:hypothetical protein